VIRDEVRNFVRLGPLTSELDNSEDGDEAFGEMEHALHSIEKPVTDEEARLLLGSFGEDNSFGLAWSLLHLVESAPTPPVTSEPPPGSNPWLERMWVRYRNSLTD